MYVLMTDYKKRKKILWQVSGKKNTTSLLGKRHHGPTGQMQFYCSNFFIYSDDMARSPRTISAPYSISPKFPITSTYFHCDINQV